MVRLSATCRHRRGSDDGAVAILVAIFAVVMFGFAAIIVDLGAARSTSNDAQNAADAAVLAAANALYADDLVNGPNFPAAVDAAKDYAEDNYGTATAEWAGCADPGRLAYRYPAGGTECISFDEQASPTTVRVRIPLREVGSFFGGIVGYDGLTISAIAEASTERVPQECVVCVFGEINVEHPDGKLNVSGGGSVHAGRLEMHDHAVEDPGKITVVGGGVIAATVADPAMDGDRYDPNPPKPLLAVVNPLTVGTPLPDPLNPTPEPATCDGGDTDPLEPGSYTDITVPPGQDCYFDDGLFRITGKVKFPDGGDLIGGNVTLYFTCTETCDKRLEGPGTVKIDGWDDTDDWNTADVSLFLGTGTHGPLEIGGGPSTIGGTIYAPTSHLQLQDAQKIEAHRVVVDKLNIHRDAELSVNVPLPIIEPSGFGLSK